MNLYLMRHGVAVERTSVSDLDDDHRPLTPDGKRKVRRIARALRSLGCSFDMILSSPLLRARQTADIVADECGNEIVRLDDNLRPGRTTAGFLQCLDSDCVSLDSVLVVGHEPDLGQLTGILLDRNPAMDVRIRKGGVVRLRIDRTVMGGTVSLEWVLPPRVLLQLG
jgi:phosphohistidine phosphatase